MLYRDFRSPWSVSDCEKCRDGEEVYYCTKCRRFFCERCLIKLDGVFVCPNYNHKEVIKVSDFFNYCANKIKRSLTTYEKLHELVSEEILGGLEFCIKKLDDFKKFKSIKYFIYREKIFEVLNILEEKLVKISINFEKIFRNLNDLVKQIFLTLNSSGNILDVEEKTNMLIDKIDFNRLDLDKILDGELVKLSEKIRKDLEILSNVPTEIFSQLFEGEYLVDVLDTNYKGRRVRIILTSERLAVYKKVKKISWVYYKEIENISLVKKMFFRGITISLKNGNNLRISCDGFDCISIIDAIKNVLNQDFIFSEENKEILTVMKKINSLNDEILKKIFFASERISKMFDEHYRKFISKFYINGNSSYSISSINDHHDLNKFRGNGSEVGDDIEYRIRETLKTLRSLKKKLLFMYEEGRISPKEFYEEYYKIVTSEERLETFLKKISEK